MSRGSALHTIDNRNTVLEMKTFLLVYEKAIKSSQVIYLSKLLGSSFDLHIHFTPCTIRRRATSFVTMKLLEANHVIPALLEYIWLLE